MIRTTFQSRQSTTLWLGLGCLALAIATSTAAYISASDPRLAIAQAETAAQDALAQSGLTWATVRFEDNIAHISGEAPGEAQRVMAYEVVRKALRTIMTGTAAVNGVNSHITLAAAPIAPAPASLAALTEPVIESRPRLVTIETPAATPSASAQATAAPPSSAAKAPLETASVKRTESLAPADCKAEFAAVLSSKAIVFAKDSAAIARQSDQVLDQLAGIAKRCGTSRLTIEGHTDSTGTTAHNKQLSQRRAEAVRVAMVTRGVAKDRLAAQGFGAARMIAKGTSESALAKNRRIEFAVSALTGAQKPAARK